jgi:two-component sensor histidine kinase/ABC-type amino acid transport substrate-binding protein
MTPGPDQPATRASGRRRARSAIALAALLVAATTGGARADAPPPDEEWLTPAQRAWLREHPVIRLAPTPDYPPTEFVDAAGVYRGISADYMTLIEARLGIEFEIVELDRATRLLGTAERMGADVVPLSAKTPARSEHWLFTEPYLAFPAVILVHQSVDRSLDLGDMKGMRVAIVEGYAAHEFMEAHHPDLDIRTVPDTRTGLRMVSFQLVDAFVSDLPVATHVMQREGLTNLRIAGESGYVYRMGISTRKDWPVLHDILTTGLSLVSVEERRAIYDRWVHLDVVPAVVPQRLSTTVAVVTIGFVLLLSAIFLWNRSLARLVTQRTGDLERELNDRRRAEDELRAMAEVQRLLLRELDHRVKNNLAGLLTLIEAGKQSTTDVTDFSAGLGNRIMSMKLVHDIIARAKFRTANLQELLEQLCRHLAPSAVTRIRIDGPVIRIEPRQASAMAMILQELLTNCQKHGALAGDRGRVSVHWDVDERTDESVGITLTWHEHDGPPAREPECLGVGLNLIRGFTSCDLGGECRWSFDDRGFRCVLQCRLDETRPPVEPPGEATIEVFSGPTPGAPSPLHN